VDLFEPGSGSQVHDFNGGILASGLFWTLPVPDDALWVSHSGRRAILEVEDLAVLDSFQFFGPNQTPASVSCRVEWRASDGFVPRGKGLTVPPDDPAAFLGDIAVARSTGFIEGSEFGFAFEARGDTDPGGYAQMGRERNGVFLS
jgi:hypothetical protein